MGNWSSYILPVVGAILILVLNLPETNSFLKPYIPNPYYLLIAKALFTLAVLILVSLWLYPPETA